MSNVKICAKCIQPNTRPGIYFSQESICGACLWEEEKNKINWNERIKELRNIVEDAKDKKATYITLMGVTEAKKIKALLFSTLRKEIEQFPSDLTVLNNLVSYIYQRNY